VIKLIRFEIVRLLTRKRLYIIWLLMLASSLYIFFNRHYNFQNPGGPLGQFFESVYPLSLLLPLFVGVGTGDTIAEDREQRYIHQLLSRSKNRSAYLLAKGIGMGVTKKTSSPVFPWYEATIRIRTSNDGESQAAAIG
jgi:ABC-type transport system involved in multi-copper enzyme maturation permease subunit